MKPPENSQSTDSKTNVDVEKTRFLEKLTVRCDPQTKKALKEFSRQTGITECQIIHALLTGYFTGLSDRWKVVDKSPTINLTIERSVERVRRYGREVVRPEVEEYGGRGRCSISGCLGRVLRVVQVEEPPGHFLVQWFCGAHFGERRRELRRLRRPFGFREV